MASVEGTPGVRQLQVIQTGPTTLRVRLAASGDEAAAWDALAGRLRGYLSARGLADIVLERSAEPPRRDSVSGKLREVWSESG